MINLHELYENVCAGGLVPDNKLVIIPKGIEKIESDAFKDKGVRKLRLPQGLALIESGAFEGHALQEINLPDELIALEPNSFKAEKPGTIVKIKYKNAKRPYLFLSEAFDNCNVVRLEIGNLALSKPATAGTIWEAYEKNNQASGVYEIDPEDEENFVYSGFWKDDHLMNVLSMIKDSENIKVKSQTELLNDLEKDPEEFARTLLDRDLISLSRELKISNLGEQRALQELELELELIKEKVLVSHRGVG